MHLRELRRHRDREDGRVLVHVGHGSFLSVVRVVRKPVWRPGDGS
ncbi:hypothetical protein Cus16_1520 [Curtobacterium sp. ER1/6]|nr:hypothetical protein Cus16_1520 [Curtobacterium sp. ER1/6]